MRDFLEKMRECGKYVKMRDFPHDCGMVDTSASTCTIIIKCVCLNARSIINKKTELNIMVDDIKLHIIGITESWANNDITNAELGLEGYVMFRKDIIGRRGGGVLLYIKDTIPAYEVQLQEKADCNEAIWCNLVTGHTTVIIGVVYRCPNITKVRSGIMSIVLFPAIILLHVHPISST